MKLHLVISALLSIVLLAALVVRPAEGHESDWLHFLGRFHPLILHLPIGALLVLGLMEALHMVRAKWNLDVACRIVLWVSVLSAVPAVLAGFLLASSGGYRDALLARHQWLGLGTALLAVWLLYVRRVSVDKPRVIWLYRPLLIVNVALLSLAGHFGGSLTHGSDYLTARMPEELKRHLGIGPVPLAGAAAAGSLTRVSDADSPIDHPTFMDHVQPTMARFCFDCHNADKQKGNIRLDALDWDLVNGPDAESWRTVLDVMNQGEMPPEDKAQPSAEQRRRLVDWMTESLAIAAKARRGASSIAFRRLTRAQYTHSLNELLGLPINFGDRLPSDAKSEMGFTNNAQTLSASPLHIDYYQQIAREALDKAVVVVGDKPETQHYRVTLGKGIGEGLTGGGRGGEFGGFQSVVVSSDDFTVDVLDAGGQPKAGDGVEAIQNQIGVGMRGSGSDRFSVAATGMNLYGALPHKETRPKSWQGPSPNLKMLIKKVFPEEGPFAFRVTASRGAFLPAAKEGFVTLRDPAPAAVGDDTLIIRAEDYEKIDNLEMRDGWLMPVDVAGRAQAEYQVTVPKAGFYQLDFVHPYAGQDAMPSYEFRFNYRQRKQERLNLADDLADQPQITQAVSLVYLRNEKNTLHVGGEFFVGFSEARLTPLPEDHTAYKSLMREADKNRKAFAEEVPSMRVFAGTRTDDGMDYASFDAVRTVEAPAGQPETYAFTGYLDNLPTPDFDPHATAPWSNMMVLGVWNDHLVKHSGQSGPPLMVHAIELEAPYHPQWPPASHTQIFFDAPDRDDEDAYTRAVLERFAGRAFRRTLTDEELGVYLDFWRNIRGDYDRYEDSVKEVLVAVLCSPNFLYVYEPEADPADTDAADPWVDPHHLASKLAYFLWDSPPDATLSRLAQSGTLRDGLPAQVDRMVQDPRVWRMIERFGEEWLRVDRLRDININAGVYPDFTRFVKADMADETYHFIHEVLAHDLSIMNFIDSDFAMLNQNLAEFYGVDGVKGQDFRRVAVKPALHRGGLLSQGAFLAGHSDGTDSHPIKRAVWVKEKILGDPPPPAPPNVPELDPDTPGFEKLTLKEQLELHRNKASCVDCHLKIDPYGVVFENYDAVGRLREVIKGRGRGKKKTADRAIDSQTVLPDGTELRGITGIKNYVQMVKRDQFTRALVEHLFAYAVGRDITFADEEEISDIAAAVKADGYTFRSVFKHVVSSPSFTQR